MNKTCKHTNIHGTHPRRHQTLKSLCSEKISFRVVPDPTQRYLKSLELNFLYCPDCEAQNIIFHGYDPKGTQRFKCKSCHYQFVAQYDAVFPRSKRRVIFEREFLENIKPTGSDKQGSGKKLYWRGARLSTLQILESQRLKVGANNMIRSHPVRTEKDYSAILEFLLHEAYLYSSE